MQSLKGFDWILSQAEERHVLQYMQSFELPEFLARILVARNVNFDDVKDFLNPSLKRLLPEPYLLNDMEVAVKRTTHAIINQQKIVVYGDYDVDGATASALLRSYLHDIGVNSSLYIPDRLDEGYGANPTALKQLRDSRYDLCLMVDCGTTAFEALEMAYNLGLDVIVLDHHTAQTELPKATAIINPNRLDQNLNNRSDLSFLCAAGVAFLFMVALNRNLREIGYFNKHNEPNLINYLDMVALGTVCDVMPLKGLNRALVTQGLKIAQKRQNLGLTTLADIAELKSINSAYHFGFILGPRINAGGRVGQADLGSNLLFTKCHLESKEIALKLNEFNLQRQEIERQVLEEAILQVESMELDKRSIIMVKGKNWHPGVVGIVASRLKDRYHKPSLVVTDWENELKGSGRSVSGIDIGVLMHQGVHKGLLTKGGGHAMASGFTVAPNYYDQFYDFLDQAAQPIMQNRKASLHIDGYLSISSINQTFLDHMQQLEPYGSGHPTPTFAFKHLACTFSDVLNDQHIRLQLQDETGKNIKAMAFRSFETPLKKVVNYRGPIEVAGTVKSDVWQGRQQLTLIVDDIRM